MRIQQMFHPFQFIHAWFLSRMLARTCAQSHTVNDNHALIVAPHPDDETLGCGGLIATKRARGAEVTVVYLTDGSAGTLNPSESPNLELAYRRRAEALAALQHLGVSGEQVQFWDYPDGALTALPADSRHAIVDKLAKLLRDGDIREVYVPHRYDGHPDHQRAFALTKAAAARPGLQVRLYQYVIWMWWSQPLLLRLQWKLFTKRTIHRVGERLEQKRTALRCHVSQWPRFPSGFLRAHPMKTELFFEADIIRTSASKSVLI